MKRESITNDKREKFAAKRFLSERERDGEDSAGRPIVRARSCVVNSAFSVCNAISGHKAVTAIPHLNVKRCFVKAGRLNCSPLCRRTARDGINFTGDLLS